ALPPPGTPGERADIPRPGPCRADCTFFHLPCQILCLKILFRPKGMVISLETALQFHSNIRLSFVANTISYGPARCRSFLQKRKNDSLTPATENIRLCGIPCHGDAADRASVPDGGPWIGGNTRV